jgi:ribosomal protein S18 acetylase RimI-like enzyme
MVLIRPAEAADAEAIGQVHVISWRETYTGILPERVLARLSVEARSRMWRTMLDRPAPAQRTPTLDFAGEYYALYVLQAAQRQGIGRTLMAAMSNQLSRSGLVSASLWVVRDNHRAIRFYERFGGVMVGTQEERRDGYVLSEIAYGWRELPLV